MDKVKGGRYPISYSERSQLSEEVKETAKKKGNLCTILPVYRRKEYLELSSLETGRPGDAGGDKRSGLESVDDSESEGNVHETLPCR